jgi:hypothetical protein
MMDKKTFQVISAAGLLAIMCVAGFQSRAATNATVKDTDCCLACDTEHVFCTDQYFDKFLGAELKSHKEGCGTEHKRCTSACPDTCENLSMETPSIDLNDMAS